MKEINTITSIAISFLIILSTAFLSINNREITPKTITINKGMSLNNVINLLQENNIIINKNVLKAKIMIQGLSSKVPTGTFLIEGKVSDSKLIDIIFNKGPIKLKLTIPEGTSSKKIFESINLLLNTNYQFEDLLTEKNILSKYDIDGSSFEGYLYPNTYYFYYDTSPEDIIDTLVSQFWKEFDENLISRANELGLSVHEVVTLASIIEGEAMLDNERSTISSVYHNRLKINMKLQADPTIQ